MDSSFRIAIMVRRLSGRGGMERVITTLAAAARRAKPPTSVEVWCFGVPHDATWLSNLPHRVVNIDQGTGRFFQLKTKLPLYARAARRFMTERAPDVLLATDPVFVRAALWARGRRDHPRIYSWIHFAVDRMANRGWLSSADGHLAISSQIAAEIRDLGTREDPVVVGNPLPRTEYPLLPVPSEGPRILYIGRLQNHQKRIDLLIAALSRLTRHRFTLDLVGDGPDRPMLEALVSQAGIEERVVWHGWQADPWEAVQASSVLALPSDFEGFPMVLLEALAHGLPVVATDCNAGPRDVVVPGANGRLVPTGDADALSQALQGFLGPPGSVDLEWSAERRRQDVLDRFSDAVVWQRIRAALKTGA